MKRQAIIEKVLENYPRARSDDKYLLLKVWQQQGLPIQDMKFVEMFLSKKISPAETVTRVRRDFQAEGKYPAMEMVGEARLNKAASIRAQIKKIPNPMRLFE